MMLILATMVTRTSSASAQLQIICSGMGHVLLLISIVALLSVSILSRIWSIFLTFPGDNPQRYLISIAKKELEWTRRIGKPLELDFPYNSVFPGVKYPETYIDLLDKYLKLVPHLIPKDSTSPFNRPTLRHPGRLDLPRPIVFPNIPEI